MADKKNNKDAYEYPKFGVNWTAGIGRPAGMYWLDGRTVLAAHGSFAEDRLISAGAILVGTLRFDSCPLERSHAGRVVDRVSAWALLGAR